MLAVFFLSSIFHIYIKRVLVVYERKKRFDCILFLIFLQLMQIMIKVSDVSNEARPMEVAEPWLDCLLQEFFIQVNLIVLLSLLNLIVPLWYGLAASQASLVAHGSYLVRRTVVGPKYGVARPNEPDTCMSPNVDQVIVKVM